jgi:molybdate transport system substrate-binding protein
MRAARRAGLALALTAAVAGLGGCGSSGKPDIKVSAASSLKQAFTAYGNDFHGANVSYSFAATDELAAQIRQGARPDVFAAANTQAPSQLQRQNLLYSGVLFAGNRLVVAVPAGSKKVRSLADLSKRGVTIAIGAPSVAVGGYARQAIGKLGSAQSGAILHNVRSNEPDVQGVVGKVSQGAVDAGFVYITDVKASGGRLKAIELPARIQPKIVYAAAVVKGTKHRGQARQFVAGLLRGPGEQALRAAGFTPPPK